MIHGISGADLVTARRAQFVAEAEIGSAGQSRSGAASQRRRRAAAARSAAVCRPGAGAGGRRASAGALRAAVRAVALAALPGAAAQAVGAGAAPAGLRSTTSLTRRSAPSRTANSSAVAHYFRDPARPGACRDQRRGGRQPSAPGHRAAAAQRAGACSPGERGITAFKATALRENPGVLAMVHNSDWPSVVTHRGPGAGHRADASRTSRPVPRAGLCARARNALAVPDPSG